MSITTTVLSLIQTGLGSLAAYLAAHVLLCLLPAFFIAGALSALIPKEAITRFLGKDAPRWLSYPAASLGGFILAVCSCTIMPLFASIYKKGAGLGPAITFLFVGPAINILAISFTGVQIGMDIAIARVVLSIIFGITIGLIMAWIFRKDDEIHNNDTKLNNAFSQSSNVPVKVWLFFLLLLAVLIAGTLQIGLFQNSYLDIKINIPGSSHLQMWLDSIIPPNPALGIEGVSVQGLLLIILLILIAIVATFGLNHIDEGFNKATYLSLILISATLIIASIRITPLDNYLEIGITGKMIAITVFQLIIWFLAYKSFEKHKIQEWLWETWRFVKQIIPLLIIGVFIAGMARVIIPANWIQTIAGKNTLWANLIGVLFGVFMYFPTLVEVPIAQTFLSLGMARGPLLAYLLADPELSLQSIMITSSVIGKRKTFVYVLLVTIFTTLSGLIFGWFIQ